MFIVFELLNGIYSERIDSCKFSIFTDDEAVRVFVNINSLCDPKRVARFIRNIALLLQDYKEDLGISDETKIGGKLI